MTVNLEIKINPDYDTLVPELSSTEYEMLKISIKDKGQQIPIYVDENGNILDGHHRNKVCKELGNKPIFEVKSFADESDKKEFVIYMNLNRRQLNDFQKSELGIKLEVIEAENAKLRQLSKLNHVKDNLSLGTNDHDENDKGRTIDIVSKQIGIKPKTYQRARTIIQYGSKEVKEKLRQGKSKINTEYKKIDNDRKRQKYLGSHLEDRDANNATEYDNDNNCKLLFRDFRQIAEKEIPDNSIDLIFTDPPFAEYYLSLYEELTRLSARVLKPGGSIVTFVGHIIMDRVINIFNKYSPTNDTGLKYWWIFAVKHSGNHTKIHARNVFAEWKPMLWCVKGKRVNNLAISNTIGDHIESIPPHKIHHKWEQSTVEAESVIRNLTLQNQTVLDPMMGSGTTGIAALNLNRKFIGIEQDPKTFKIAKARITKFRDKKRETKSKKNNEFKKIADMNSMENKQ